MGAACFLVLPVLLLSSWLTQAQAATSGSPSLEDAGAEFYALVDDTQHLAGGTWDNQDDAGTRGCVLPDGTAGRSFAALRLAAAVGSPVIDDVAAAWDDLGYTVERTEIGPVSQLIATGDSSAILIFRVSDRAMTLQGESECRPAG